MNKSVRPEKQDLLQILVASKLGISINIFCVFAIHDIDAVNKTVRNLMQNAVVLLRFKVNPKKCIIFT